MSKQNIVLPKETILLINKVDELANGPTDKAELVYLAKYASQVGDGGTIVDIGTCEGRTTLAMAVASKPNVKIHTIDINDNPKFHSHIKVLGLEDKIVVNVARSQDFVKGWKKPIDFIFIDGDHRYLTVKDDTVKWTPFVKSGHYISWHDYKNYSDTVGRAVDESEGEIYEKVEQYGIIYTAKRI